MNADTTALVYNYTFRKRSQFFVYFPVELCEIEKRIRLNQELKQSERYTNMNRHNNNKKKWMHIGQDGKGKKQQC